MFLLAFQMLITPMELPPGVMNKPYDAPGFQLTGGARCGSANAGFRVAAGKLPAGLVLSSAGSFSGVPRAEGVYPLRIEGANGCGRAFTAVNLEIQGAPIFETNERNFSWTWKAGAPAPLEREFLVAGNWPGLAYRIDGTPPWLDVSVRFGALPERNSAFEADMVTLRPVVDGLAPGKYSAALIIGAWGAARSPRVMVQLEIQ